jgi:CBS domain-containing protein
MSARAAGRLASLGFTKIFRYTPGKADWAAAGLPMEGALAASENAGKLARKSPPTCAINENLDAVRQMLDRSGECLCAVVNDQRVLLGEITAAQASAGGAAEDVMTSGPTTIRPNADLDAVRDFFGAHKTDTVWVTSSDGELLGLLHRSDLG